MDSKTMPDVTTSLAEIGLNATGDVRWNHPPERLLEDTLRLGRGSLARGGALVVNTAPYTGRSPKDKFFVQEPSSASSIAWGAVNRPIDEAIFDKLEARVIEHLGHSSDLWVQDLFGGADDARRLSIRLVSESPWATLFANNMLLRPTAEQKAAFEPDFHILHAPTVVADPDADGTRSEVFVLVHLGRKRVIIGGTRYAGEIKKSVFTLLNYLLPRAGVMAMHCSANVGAGGDVALFFGLSGTGKTTLSADPERPLIGDDEHGWSDDGVFNFEGGCYAKVIRLNPSHEPEIHATTSRFGTVLENVVFDEASRELDLDDARYTENTRAAYPITHLPNIVPNGRAGHPRNVIFLTCDAFGVLPPISRLTPEQAMYYFLSGYTAKVAGTERGIDEPQATFSACFGEPFLPLHPNTYAQMLGDKIREHGPKVWLVNTGWTGGPHGVGQRIAIPHTRAMIRAILAGELDDAAWATDPLFSLEMPTRVDGVPDELLQPRGTWADPAAYDEQAKKLAGMFRDNFDRYADEVSDAIKGAAPKL